MQAEDLELSVTRLIDAPVATVGPSPRSAWRNGGAPSPGPSKIVEQDWRAGGRSAMVMRGPNGEEIPQEGLFLEVTPGVRFVFTDG